MNPIFFEGAAPPGRGGTGGVLPKWVSEVSDVWSFRIGGHECRPVRCSFGHKRAKRAPEKLGMEQT